MKKQAQNLIEFVFIMPLLIVMIFGIVEYSLFWKKSQTVQELALKAAIAASGQIVLGNQTSNDMTNSFFNPAALQAANLIQSQIGSLGVNNISFNNPVIVSTNTSGTYNIAAPYTLYMFTSTIQANTTSGTQPLITLNVDYTDPYDNGVIVQLIYQYTTLFGGMQFSLPNGNKIVIIPSNIPISSTKIQQYINY